MGFLDNSGDIILDAVLTDAGRARLARGDGSFKIVKYAFADDEIDYSKYNKDHASGSAYFDIDILTTPVIEALTNNTSTMKNRLLSIPKTNLLYLPVMRLNEISSDATTLNSATTKVAGSYVVSCNKTTDDVFTAQQSTYSLNDNGVFLSGEDTNETKQILIDQGLDTTAIPKDYTIDPTLLETQYIIEIDNRLGYIYSPGAGGAQQAYSYLDDDNVASYNFSTDSTSIVTTAFGSSDTSPVDGPRGSRLKFRIAPSTELVSSNYLFTLLGPANESLTFGSSTASYRRIHSNVRITGATTGYRIDIPITFLKKV